MTEVFAFGVILLVAVLISGLAHRSIVSTAVLFLLAGYLLGSDVFSVVNIDAESEVLALIVELALFVVLFTDGMQIGIRDLQQSWRLPSRALLLGMPLTFVSVALFSYLLLDLSWAKAFLVGAVLTPTDPVFASAIVGRQEVPLRLRRLLNVESGLNDGLALPVVIVMLEIIRGHDIDVVHLIFEILLGVAIGVAVPWVAITLERSRFFSAHLIYEPLNTFAIGLLVLSLASITGGNEFLAAFSAGVTVSTLAPRFRDAFHEFGELVAELLKLAAIFLFGSLITLAFIRDVGYGGAALALLSLVIARPLVLGLVLAKSDLELSERIAAMWFGPKGFASVVYGLLILNAFISQAEYIFHVIAIVIVVSIIAHSSTDVLVANWFLDDEFQSETEEEITPGALVELE